MANINLENYLDAARHRAREVSPSIGNPDYVAARAAQIKREGCFTIPSAFFFPGEQTVSISLHPSVPSLPKAIPDVPHNHDFFELNYVYEGEYHQQIDDVKIVQTSDTVILLAPKALHATCVKDKESVVFNILFRRTLVEDTMLSLLDRESAMSRFFMDNIYLRDRYKPYMIFQNTDEIRHVLHKIIKEYFDQSAFCETFVAISFVELFLMFSRLSNNGLVPVSLVQDKPNAMASDVLDYIRRHYATVSLDSLAERYNYSSSKISQFIKNEFDVNFVEMVRDLRIENACQYLQHSDISIDRIIGIVGYNDVSYFYKIFKKKTGMPPQKYRQSCREVNSAVATG